MGGSQQGFVPPEAPSAIIPMVPAVAKEVADLAPRQRDCLAGLARAVSGDLGLEAQILRFTTSQYYGVDRAVADPAEALGCLGPARAQMLVLAFCLIGALKQFYGLPFDYPAFWHRSLLTGVLGRRMATGQTDQRATEVLVAGLLGDVGCPLLCRAFVGHYDAVANKVAEGHGNLDEIERELFRISHTEVSRMVLQAWNMPSQLVRAVAFHHGASCLPPEDEARPVAATVEIAAGLAEAAIGRVGPRHARWLGQRFGELEPCGPENLGLLLADLADEVNHLAALLNVPAPTMNQDRAEAALTPMIEALVSAQRQTAPR